LSNPITFYYDFISHNAYLGWHGVRELAHRHGRTVEPVAVLFAGLLDAHGTVGPAEVRAKARWMVRDVLRKARRLGIPLAPPASHPFNPLLPLRVASLPEVSAARDTVIDALFRAAWAEGRAISETAVVAEVLAEAGLDGTGLVAQAQSAEAKERVRAQTDAAIADAMFGVPTMVVDGELFWGFDDLGHLELFLRGEDPLPTAELERWWRVRPSAQRRQRPQPG
jgi:2-hydroxychromene-2-carboxylate isomerase